MGGRGTDVAREASSIVLLDDDFSSIVRTVRLGRRIYDNLRKAMGYIIAVHVPIAGIALLPLLTGLPLVLLPLHIALLEMIIDPVCSIAFEAEHEEPDVMARPPRAPDAKLFSSALLTSSLLQGLAALLATSAVYLFGVHRGLPDGEVRAVAFLTLVLSNLGLVIANRSYGGQAFDFLAGGNRALLGIHLLTAAVLALAIAVPSARALFGFAAIGGDGLLAAALALALLGLALALIRRRAGPLRQIKARSDA
jgi:Ca2+-transporting ATPase